MGKNIKRLSLALLALGLSAPAFADTCCASPCTTSCNPFTVSIPTQQGGFSFGADALYVKPSASNGAYITIAGTNTGTTTAPAFNDTIRVADPSYQWGFDVNAAYRIPCTGNDVTAIWTHLGNNSDNHDHVSFPVSIGIGDDVFLPGAITASGNVDFNNYDAVDIDFGQRVNFGDYFNFRIFTGVRWAQVEENINATATLFVPGIVGALPATTATDAVQDESKFNGVGPQFGLDGRYCLGYGFGVDANITTSLLIGTGDASTTETITTATVGAATTQAIINTDLDNRTGHVVPALDASLGLDYTYNFNHCNRSSLVIQAGWKVIQYWDVAHNMFANGDHAPGDFTTSAGFGTGGLFPNTANSVAFSGPYAGIKVNL
jgi:hypothetical protein